MEGSVKWFSEVNRDSADLIGQKAAYLAEAHNKKFLTKNVRVPEGFVITKNVIENFYKENNIDSAILNIFEEVNYGNKEELDRAISQAKKLILQANFSKEVTDEILDAYETLGAEDLDSEGSLAHKILANGSEPVFVAVRSSDEPGESYFNIKGNSSVISHIKKVLASFITSENLKEYHMPKIDIGKLYSAVIIQEMIQADKSGTLHTDDKYRIKAIWGLGSGLSQDEIGKDVYILRRDARVLDKKVAEKKYAITRDSSGSLKAVQLKEGYSFHQVLDDHEFHPLSDVALRLEDIFGQKVEFDFAIEDDEISIVKIGPMTSWEEPETEVEEEIVEAIKEDIKEDSDVVEVEEIEEVDSKDSLIMPLENLSKTKVELILETREQAEISENTLLKSGLVFLEKIIEARGIHPKEYIENYNTKGYEEVIYSGISENSRNLKDVWVRLSDFTTGDFKGLEGAPEGNDVNPLMGLCGIRFLLHYPELLKRELRAISNLKNDGKDVGVLIPKISSVYELKKVKEFLKDLNSDLRVGVVLETPASMQLIKDFIEEGIEAAYFSGDNLVQYLLAIDKNNKEMADMYDDTTPALMYQLEYVIRVCKRRDVKTAFFGNATKKKEMVEFLTRKEIPSILCEPEFSHKIHEEIKGVEEKFLSGTDKEPRQYETNKEKERQQKEIEEFEKMKENQAKQEAKQLSVASSQSMEKRPEGNVEVEEVEVEESDSEEEGELVEDIDTAIELIEAERAESENSEVIEESDVEDVQELFEKEKEEFKAEVENEESVGPNDRENKDLAEVEAAVNELSSNNDDVAEVSPHIGLPSGEEKAPTSVEEAMRLIEEHNNSKPRETDVERAMREIEEHNVKSLEPKALSHEQGLKVVESEEIEEIKANAPSVEEAVELIREEREEYENSNDVDEIVTVEEETAEIDFGDLSDSEEVDSDPEEFEEDFEDRIIEDLSSEEVDSEPEFTGEKKDPLGIFG